MKEDKIKQFEISLIELNRYLAYKEKDSAINCYNKIHQIYNEILDSDLYFNQKQEAYNLLINYHKKITSPPQTMMKNSDIVFLTLVIFLSSILLLTGPEITAMLISQQKPNIVKNIYIFSTFLLILLPTAIILLKNAIKKD